MVAQPQKKRESPIKRSFAHKQAKNLIMEIDLHIEGVSDAVADAIRKRVRRLRQFVSQRGEWRITVSPSETRGQWDLGVQVSSRRHFASFNEAIDRLPDVIELKLREFLELPSSVVPTVGR